MAYGGGTWVTQNKKLPGAYANFVSKRTASATLSDRGIVAVALDLDWGEEGKVYEVTASDFLKNSMSIFGRPYEDEKLLYLRELFCHASKVLIYRLGTSTKASNTYATAKYGGERGNDITIIISANVDNTELFDVKTNVGGKIRDTQTVAKASELVSNAWVDFKTEATLAVTVGEALKDGANAESTGEDHQAFLGIIEGYSFNILCCGVADETTVGLYEAFTKRTREETGSKFQLVAWQADADHEGVIGVWNKVETSDNVPEHTLVYWVSGAEAAVKVNQSLTNTAYDGELTVITKDIDAEEAIDKGHLIFHNAQGAAVILTDINSLVTLTDEKGAAFKMNQTIRVIDQIANDMAVLYCTRHLGKTPNDADGRAALWNDSVELFRKLEKLRAIESFDPEKLTVTTGEEKGAVLFEISELYITNVMEKLYMSITIV